MIRPYTETDQDHVFRILTAPGGHFMSEDKVSFDGFQEVFVYEVEDDVVGFLALEVDAKISQIICYVAPSKRGNGIGTTLYNYGRAKLASLDPNTIWVFFRNDVGSSATFYQNRGALSWYSYHFMAYEGEADGVDILMPYDEVIPYDARYFDTYLEVRADAFLDLNREIDSRPYDERERRDEIEKWTEKNKDKIWLFLKDGQLVGSIALYDGFFDEVFVAKNAQRSGMGSAIVNWALQLCKTNDWRPGLCVVTSNKPAVKLYEKNGFVVKQTLELNRLFSENKVPDLRGPIGG